MEAIKLKSFRNLLLAIEQGQIKTSIDNDGNVVFIYIFEPEKFT
jgi:hypothetical protein